MLKNFILVTIRSFFRGQIYAAINVARLVVGLTCSIFIFLWVMDEIRFDRFHKDHDRIYNVLSGREGCFN